MMGHKKITSIEWEIKCFERDLKVKFPESYRNFLLEQGSAVIAGYRILGIPKPEKKEELEEERLDLSTIAENISCPVCKKQKQRGKITCYNCYNRYSSETNRQSPLSLWVKDKLSFQKKKTKEKREYSVVEATEIFRKKRKDLPQKLVVICTEKSPLDGKEIALCIDTARIQGDDAPLVEVSDINQEGSEVNQKNRQPRKRLFFCLTERIK